MTNESTVQEPKRSPLLASNKQLWILNKHGWLTIRETPEVDAAISSQHANLAIQRSIEEAGD